MAAIDQYVETNIVKPTEKEVRDKDMVEWGEGNGYPAYLVDLYDNVPTLKSIIDGDIDYIAGDDVVLGVLPEAFAGGIVNRKGDTFRDLIKDIAHDEELFGGFALQIVRDHNGDPAEIYYINLEFLRSNKENDVFYYCENWGKRGPKDTIVYPKFLKDINWESLDEAGRKRHASSILFVKDNRNKVYPSPKFAAAVIDCETERCTSNFHLNAVNNNFEASAIINFNNGVPDDKMREEIEQDVIEKYSGHQNGARIMLVYNSDKAHATTIEYPKVDDFGNRYQALASHCREQIFTSFRAIPLLFGLTSESNTGFSVDEFEQSFKLYNRTQIRPVQRMIVEALEKVLGKGAIAIRPFTLDGGETNIS